MIKKILKTNKKYKLILLTLSITIINSYSIANASDIAPKINRLNSELSPYIGLGYDSGLEATSLIAGLGLFSKSNTFIGFELEYLNTSKEYKYNDYPYLNKNVEIDGGYSISIFLKNNNYNIFGKLKHLSVNASQNGKDPLTEETSTEEETYNGFAISFGKDFLLSKHSLISLELEEQKISGIAYKETSVRLAYKYSFY